MRVESFKINTQINKGKHQPSKWIASLLMRIYAALLKLYPLSFRAAFAAEMMDVFAMTLRESSSQLGLIFILWRELYGLPASLIEVYHQAFHQLPPAARRVQQIRWFVRIMGGLLSLFLLSTLRVLLSPSYNLYVQAVPFVAALFVACVSMLVGLHWERVGGLLTIASGAALGCCMTLYLYVMGVAEIGIVATVLIGLVWALPFLIFGLLFYGLSKQPKLQLSAI